MGAGAVGLQHIAFTWPSWPVDDRNNQAPGFRLRRSYTPAQPSRRALILVYLACVAVPFAVAAMAYLLRDALSEPTLHARAKPAVVNSLAGGASSADQRPNQAAAHSSMSLLPSAAAAELPNSPGTQPPSR
jgi:hypothetical protein